MSVGERISERLEALGGRTEGFSQAWLARKVGISQPTINSLIRRPESGSKHLHEIAKALQTSTAYLLGETQDPRAELPSLPIETTIARLGLTMIPEVDISFSMGGGSVVEEDVYERRVPFRTAWISRLTRGGPADVFLARGTGDSMTPTIQDDDDVLVNRSDNRIGQQDRIWALGYGDLAMIKRVRRLPSGIFQLNSDNKIISPIEATDEEFRVLGRVIWIGRAI